MKTISYKCSPMRDDERKTEIAVFVLAVMSDLYPKGSYHENPRDLAMFKDTYVRPDDACFWIAEDNAGTIVGTAALRPYNGRFQELNFLVGEGGPVCEMVKFYIHPDYRRCGIGSQLYGLAEGFALEAGYSESYMHTSLFLPGGHRYWQRNGYVERYWESEQLVHMSKRL